MFNFEQMLKNLERIVSYLWSDAADRRTRDVMWTCFDMAAAIRNSLFP